MLEVRPRPAALRLAASLCVACLLVYASGAPASAQLIGQDPEFQVNSFTPDDQLQADVAATSAGQVIVVWTSSGSPEAGGDTSGTSVQAQRYTPGATLDGEQFQVNSYSTGNQFLPSVATADAGHFMVVWMTQLVPDGDSDIRGRYYAADGTPSAVEFQVNTTTTGRQYEPSLAVDDAGRFVVVWDSESGDGDGFSIRGQRYAADGTASSAEFQVNSHTPGSQLSPVASMEGGSGSFVVAWQSETSPGTDASGSSVQARRFNASAVAQGNDFQVNTTETGNQQSADVAHAPNGSFSVVWESESSSGSDSSLHSIQARRFDASGTALGDDFQVNTHTPTSQRYPSLAFDASNSFVVAWDSSSSSGSDSSLYSIQARRFNSSGTGQGDDFQVNTFTTTEQNSPSVTRRFQDQFVIAWQSRGSFGTDGARHSVQLAPEPQAAALQLAAITGLALLARRRRAR